MLKEITLNDIAVITGVQPSNVGAHVADYLKRTNVSLLAAAKQMGCSVSALRKLIKGAKLTAGMAKKIHRSFGLSVATLFNLESSFHKYRAAGFVK